MDILSPQWRMVGMEDNLWLRLKWGEAHHLEYNIKKEKSKGSNFNWLPKWNKFNFERIFNKIIAENRRSIFQTLPILIGHGQSHNQ